MSNQRSWASTNTKTKNINQWPKSPELVDISSRLANLDSIFIQHIEQKRFQVW